MKHDFNKIIDTQNQLIKALEHKCKVKDQIIQEQEQMYMELKKHNAELNTLLENILASPSE